MINVPEFLSNPEVSTTIFAALIVSDGAITGQVSVKLFPVSGKAILLGPENPGGKLMLISRFVVAIWSEKDMEFRIVKVCPVDNTISWAPGGDAIVTMVLMSPNCAVRTSTMSLLSPALTITGAEIFMSAGKLSNRTRMLSNVAVFSVSVRLSARTCQEPVRLFISIDLTVSGLNNWYGMPGPVGKSIRTLPGSKLLSPNLSTEYWTVKVSFFEMISWTSGKAFKASLAGACTSTLSELSGACPAFTTCPLICDLALSIEAV